MPTHRRSPMCTPSTTEYHQKRRNEALERQRKTREANLVLRRNINSADSVHMMDEAAEVACQEEDLTAQLKRSLRVGDEHVDMNERHTVPKNELMHPDWMLDVPHDITENWLVRPRPEGIRCMVIATRGVTLSRKKNGGLMHRFPSFLPGGSKVMAGSVNQPTVLDCIYHPQNEVYYVLDVIYWRGMPMVDCSADFRLYWVIEKLKESNALETPSKYHKYRFDFVQHQFCTEQNLRSATYDAVPFIRDGILLLHKDCLYRPGNTPLLLLWKDSSCSRYFLDTDKHGQLPPHQMTTLMYDGHGGLQTEDEPPLQLGVLEGTCECAIDFSIFRKGTLMRFTIQEKGINVVDGKVQGIDLHFQEVANQRKGRADSISKILFQYLARLGQITFENLITQIRGTSYQSQDHCMDETQ